jgi:hypothetical protein
MRSFKGLPTYSSIMAELLHVAKTAAEMHTNVIKVGAYPFLAVELRWYGLAGDEE